MTNSYNLFKYFAFKMDPEHIHEYCIKLFSNFSATSYFLPHLNNQIDKFSLSDGHMKWSFPVGLAAGFDKNAQAIDFFNKLGFGAVEVGTVTPLAQEGNPRPRIFRLPEIHGLRNSMGFPNQGMDKILKNINAQKCNGVLGVNLGKNKLTSEHDTPSDYQKLYKQFARVADYLVINVSSPNTEGLRNFQNPEGLSRILIAVEDVRKEIRKPLYLKIAPDLKQQDVYDLVDLAKKFNLSGVIATNTTVKHNYGPGGLSGDYIKPYAKKVRQWATEAARESKSLSIIGVGGVDSATEVIEFLEHGGSFMQIYTSFIYKGPAILSEIAKGLDDHLVKVGAKTLQEWVDSIRKTS